MLLIGSKALNHWCPDFRKGLDTDFIAYEKDVYKFFEDNQIYNIKVHDNHITARKGDLIYDFELALPGSTSETILNKCKNGIADINTLFLLKMSHKFKKNSKHFLKTMRDLQYLISVGAAIDDAELLKAREKETYNYSHPNLNQSKADFFSDVVSYEYDHDSIHRAVAIGAVPAYTLYIKNGSEVLCDFNKWEALPYINKLHGVIEECYVLALERSIIPHKTDPYKAFIISLQKVCTSITSGWFREFAYWNYDSIVNLYDASFVEKFNSALHSGIILPFTRK